MTYRVWESNADRRILRLVRAQQRRVIGPRLHMLMCLRGTDISPQAHLGPGLLLKHAGIGVVIHPKVTIGRDVTIYQGVTLGRADMWQDEGDFAGIDVGDHAILCAGAVIVARGTERLVIAPGTIVGANAVLTRPTGPGEIWAGAPARKVGDRPAGWSVRDRCDAPADERPERAAAG